MYYFNLCLYVCLKREIMTEEFTYRITLLLKTRKINNKELYLTKLCSSYYLTVAK